MQKHLVKQTGSSVLGLHLQPKQNIFLYVNVAVLWKMQTGPQRHVKPQPRKRKKIAGESSWVLQVTTHIDLIHVWEAGAKKKLYSS